MPGNIVLRNTTVCRRSRWASSPPISLATRSRYAVLRLPFGAEGVPTQISETSVAAIASATSVVARSEPARYDLSDQLADLLLDDGCTAASYQIDLDRIDVDADDVVPLGGEARR